MKIDFSDMTVTLSDCITLFVVVSTLIIAHFTLFYQKTYALISNESQKNCNQ